MGTVIFLMIVAVAVAGVIWNHRNKSTAMQGIEFRLPEPPRQVADAIAALYCRGSRATMKRVLSKITVTAMGSSGFTFDTKFGDAGEIEVHPGPESGSVVRARTSSLYIGANPRPATGDGYWALGRAIANVICRMLGIAPNAGRMKRFQSGLEQRVTRQIGRQVGA